jgi:hypothetical protein
MHMAQFTKQLQHRGQRAEASGALQLRYAPVATEGGGLYSRADEHVHQFFCQKAPT